MFKVFNIKSPLGLATIEICLSKKFETDLINVDVIAYGNWYCNQFKTYKECLDWVREMFYIKKKGKENG